ncbi:MAG: CDP-alcohol phosphatidyltransferase family protein [Actinomycetota bacterium]
MSQTDEPTPAHDEEVVLDRALTIPNLITISRMLVIPLFAWVFLMGEYDAVALVLLVLIGSTDWLDGFVARRIGQVSKLGKLLDPVADRMAIIVVLLALVFRGVIPVLLAGALLLRDLIVSVAFPVLEAKGFERIPVNRTGKWATAFIFAGMALAAGSVLETPVRQSVEVAAVALLTAGAVAYWAAGFLYVKAIRRQVRERVTA